VQRLYVVCGQSGVGKSTVIAKVAEGRDDLTILNFGERILAMALRRGVLSNPGDMASLGPETLSRLQMDASRHIHELGGEVILDMHLTVKTPMGFIAGMPKVVMDTLQPALIVLLEADPYEILKRRMTGKSDLDADESLKDIQERADFDRAAAISIAIDLGIPIKILKNRNADETADMLAGLLGIPGEEMEGPSIRSPTEGESLPAL
jgi:adenylate kinase